MRTHPRIFLCILIMAVAAHVASAKVSINGRTVSTSTFRIVWSSGADVEAITELHWMGGQSLTDSFATGSCNNGDVEYFGNAWAPPDPTVGGAVLVGAGTTGGVWSPTAAGTVYITSTSTGCAPSSAGVGVATAYTFEDTAANKNQFAMLRRFNFGNIDFARPFRPYIPRFSLELGFTQVLYPAVGGVLGSMDARNCPYGCTGPLPVAGAAPLDTQWDSNQQWYAVHNPATGQGVVIMRQRSTGANGSLIQSQLWIDWDGGSNANSSSFLLMSTPGGFLGNLSENETFCFYDQNSWTPSVTPPLGCQPQGNGDWPQWGHDAGHTGYNSGEKVLGPSNVGTLAFKWALFNSNFSSELPFAIANGLLYAWGDFGLGQGLYAFNAITGDPQPVWLVTLDQLEFTNGSCVDPGPRLAVDKGVVYLACPYNTVYGWIFAINAANGAIEGQKQGDLVFTVSTEVLYLSGWQYVAARSFYQPVEWIFEDWELGFNYDTNRLGYGSPVSHASVDNGVALWNYQGFLDWYGNQHPGGVLAMNAEDGSVLWYGNPGGDSEPVAAGGLAYLVLGGSLVAFNEKDGTQLRNLPGLGAPVIGGGMGYASCGGDLCAFNALTGKATWRAPGGGSPLALANGVVYANGAFDAKTGRALGGVGGIVANGMVYISDGVSVIFAFGLPK